MSETILEWSASGGRESYRRWTAHVEHHDCYTHRREEVEAKKVVRGKTGKLTDLLD